MADKDDKNVVKGVRPRGFNPTTGEIPAIPVRPPRSEYGETPIVAVRPAQDETRGETPIVSIKPPKED